MRKLVLKGWMMDFSPGAMGSFFRVVISGGTRRETVEGLVKAIELVAEELEL